MSIDELNNKYFEWMYQLVSDYGCARTVSYRKLLYCLHKIDFNYIIAMDGNRAEDGIAFRYRFGDTHSYDQSMIATYLDNRPCSVLEMMIALAFRCEDQIMEDLDIGNRMGKWFWNMIKSLGLGSMSDTEFDMLNNADNYINDVITRFLNREYEPNGQGGLFTIKNCKCDLRTVEIWYQMCWYLDSIS